MTSHIYNTRNNPLSTVKENVSLEANFEASDSSVISETANLILSLEKKLISRFSGLDKKNTEFKRRNHQKPARRKSTSQEES